MLPNKDAARIAELEAENVRLRREGWAIIDADVRIAWLAAWDAEYRAQALTAALAEACGLIHNFDRLRIEEWSVKCRAFLAAHGGAS